MINNPVLQGDMHSDTIMWREREEPKGTEFLCNLFISQVYSAVQAVWEPHPADSCCSSLLQGGLRGAWQASNHASKNSHPQKLYFSW